MPIPQRNFIVRPISAVRQSSVVTDSMRGRYYTIPSSKIKLVVINWHTIYPTTHHDDIPLYR